MADGVAITAGSGTTIATDDAGASGHVQIVKLALSADGSASAITADSKGLKVQQATAADLNVTEASAAAIKTAVELIDDAVATTASAIPSKGIAASGTDGTNARVLKTDSSGELQIDVLTVPEHAGAAASTMNATSSDGGTALTSTAQAIKASAGKLVGYFVYNPNTTAQFVQFYNVAAASVTVGTTNPLFMLTIPPTSAANLWMQPGGITFSNAGWSWAATSTAGGNGSPTTALDAVAWYV
jgi:hypothetical protein